MKAQLSARNRLSANTFSVFEHSGIGARPATSSGVCFNDGSR